MTEFRTCGAAAELLDAYREQPRLGVHRQAYLVMGAAVLPGGILGAFGRAGRSDNAQV